MHCRSSAPLAMTPSGSSTHHPCSWDSTQLHPQQLGCWESTPSGPTSTPSRGSQCCVSTHIFPPSHVCPIPHPFSSFPAPSEMPPSPSLTICHCASSIFRIWLDSPYCIFLLSGAVLPHVWLHSPPHFLHGFVGLLDRLACWIEVYRLALSCELLACVGSWGAWMLPGCLAFCLLVMVASLLH